MSRIFGPISPDVAMQDACLRACVHLGTIRAVADSLGISVGLAHRHITEGCAHLARIGPDIVFLPHGNDQKPGHRNVYALLQQAAARHSAPMPARATGRRTPGGRRDCSGATIRSSSET
ncbi:MAG: hypothetical protein WCH98_15410 [Verrucomicrobiota bacterium]